MIQGGQATDEALQAALIKRDENLTPNSNEQTAITNLVNTIQAVLDGLIVSGRIYQIAFLKFEKGEQQVL